MKISIISILFSIVFSTSASAAKWVEVGGSESVTVFVDKDSLRRNGNRVKSWLKWEWSKPVDVPNVFPVKFYQLERQLQVSDCQSNMLAIAQGIRYVDSTGNEVVDSYTFSEKQWRFTEAAPETLGESIIKFVCKTTMQKIR